VEIFSVAKNQLAFKHAGLLTWIAITKQRRLGENWKEDKYKLCHKYRANMFVKMHEKISGCSRSKLGLINNYIS